MKVLVLGRGISGDGAILLLDKEGIEYDYLNIDEVSHLNYELVVKSSGIPFYNELIKDILAKKIKIITDIELAYLLRKKFYIGITGSNGKTTTVNLIADILKQKYKVVTCGNIGYSVCKAVVENEDADIFVVELSSFQLENSQLDLDISVILNINSCHLDHHLNAREYIESKANICLNQSRVHNVIYNFNDENIKGFINNSQANKTTFSSQSVLADCYINNNYVYYHNRKIVKLGNEWLNKKHLIDDVLASVSATLLLKKIKKRNIKKAIKHFKEIDYRLTKINKFIYNDAKSTNPYSTIAALKCFDNVILICGGYDRNENLDCLNDYLHKIKSVFCYGSTKDKIYEYMNNHNIACQKHTTLEEAFINALTARREEIVLFSPMFASFDMFKSYEERGYFFNSLVKKYIK